MAFILNESDVDEAARRAAHEVNRPNLQRACLTLSRLVDWTNSNSDGWPYWQKPSNAAAKLQRLIHSRYFGRWDEQVEDDLTKAEVKSAEATIRSFLTRHGSGMDEVFPNGLL